MCVHGRVPVLSPCAWEMLSVPITLFLEPIPTTYARKSLDMRLMFHRLPFMRSILTRSIATRSTMLLCNYVYLLPCFQNPFPLPSYARKSLGMRLIFHRLPFTRSILTRSIATRSTCHEINSHKINLSRDLLNFFL